MSNYTSNIDIARQYLIAIADGETGMEALEFLAPDIVQEEFPNQLVTTGARRTMDDLVAAAKRGRKAVSSQRYDVINAVADGNTVVLEVNWEGTLAISFGKLNTGDIMRCRSAMFLEFENGKIKFQRNYDCFEAF